MTVAELISRLAHVPKDWEVRIAARDVDDQWTGSIGINTTIIDGTNLLNIIPEEHMMRVPPMDELSPWLAEEPTRLS